MGRDVYLIRFNLDKMLSSNFPGRILYLWKKLASTQIPMPPVLKVGRLGDLYFAIYTRKMPGKMLFHSTPEEIEQMFPQIMETLDAIHHVRCEQHAGLWRIQ